MTMDSEPGTPLYVTFSQGTRAHDGGRCLLRTGTVITGHHHVKPTKLAHVARHKAPYKFRVRGRLLGFHPEVSTPEELLQLFCPTCHFLGQDDQLTGAVAGAVHEGIQHYKCPVCLKAQKDHGPCTDPRGASELQFVYTLRLLVEDNTGWLPLILRGEEAVKFFHQLEPTDLLLCPSEFTRIRTRLVDICRHRQIVECCVRSFNTPEGVTYEMFDTMICWDA